MNRAVTQVTLTLLAVSLLALTFERDDVDPAGVRSLVADSTDPGESPARLGPIATHRFPGADAPESAKAGAPAMLAEVPFEFPIVVMASNNQTATTSTTFDLSTTDVNQLFVYINNIAYAGKGRVWLDNGTAKTPIVFRESSVAVCAARESLEGCFANNSNRNHRALLNLPGDWKSGSNPLRVGQNTLVFEMTMPTGSDPVWISHGHGYRVRFFDFVKSSEVTQNGNGLTTWDKNFRQRNRFDNISGTPVFVEYGSPAWKAAGMNGKLGDAGAIARGKAHFEARDLTGTQAACADCHMSHGGDLALWQFEPETIIEVGRSRGKTVAESEDIAAYILSYEWKVDGQVESARSYPWCSPYQPGVSMITGLPMSQSPAHLRAFGSCDVLDYDAESAPDFNAVTDRFVPGTNLFEYFDVPISIELPSWHSWLPIEHILDIENSEATWGPLKSTYLAAARVNNIDNMDQAGQAFSIDYLNNRSDLRLGSTTQEKSVTGANAMRSFLMSFLEGQMASGISWEDNHSDKYSFDGDGISPLCRGWTRMTRTLFELAPHLSGAADPTDSWMYSPVGDERGEKWANHAWYQLPTYANYGCYPQASGTGPNDYGYQAEFLPHANSGYRYLGNVINTTQFFSSFNSSGGLSSNSGGFSNYHGMSPFDTGHPWRIMLDFYNTSHPKSKRILSQVSPAGVAAFWNTYWKLLNKNASAYNAIDPTFDKVCTPLPGVSPPTTDWNARSGGYGNKPCIDRGGQDGLTTRGQWQQPNVSFLTSPSAVSILPDDRQGEYFYTMLYRANATPGVDKDILQTSAAWLDNLFNSGNKFRNEVTGSTTPPPPDPDPDPDPDPTPDPLPDSVETTIGWNNLREGIVSTEAVIPDAIYPVGGVNFWVNGQFNRNDPTGPRESGDGIFIVYPARQLFADDEVMAVWSDQQGNRWFSIGVVPCVGASCNPAPPPGPATQSVALQQGWNMVSGYVAPESPDMASVFASISDDITLVKDGDGMQFHPESGLNTIGSWSGLESYQVYANAATSLNLSGTVINPTSPINLEAGWNQIPFLNAQEISVDQALQSISGSLTLLKDYAGRVYYPAFGIDEIGSLRPGQGYKLHASGDVSLTYPASGQAGAKSAGGFDPFGVASSSTAVVNAPEYADGMRVSAVTSAGRVVGSGVVSGGKALIRMVGDDALTEGVVEGAMSGDEIHLLGVLPGNVEELELDAIRIESVLEDGRLKASINYVEDAVFVIELDDLPQTVELQQNFPNPFAESTTIRYTLSRPGRIKVELFNVVGERMTVLVDEDQASGSHSVVVDGSRLASGVYVYRFISDQTVAYKQMLLVR